MTMTPIQAKKKRIAHQEAMIDFAYACVDKRKSTPYSDKPYMESERRETANNPEGYETAGYAV